LLTKKSLDGLSFLKEEINYRDKKVLPLAYYQKVLLEKNPKLLESEEDIAIAHKNIAVIQAKYKPSLTAQVGYEYTQNYTPIVIGRTYESGAFVGISTMIPIYTGGRYQAETQKAMMAVREEEEKKEQEANQLLLSLQKEYRLYNSIVLEIEVARQHLETLALLKEQASIKTEEGTMFPIEKARINYQYKELENYVKQLEYNYFLADVNVKYLAGTLCREDLMRFDAQLTQNSITLNNLNEG
jgi:outer membrane protein TolC